MGEIARSTFIVGGQRSGKSRCAELLARHWLDASADQRAVMVATGQAWDDEMRERIARYQADRAERVPGMVTVEVPLVLAEAVQQHSDARTLVVVHCLTLWLTRLMMPPDPAQALSKATVVAAGEGLCADLHHASGPLVLVGNEIGLGVIPLVREVRAFVDALGRLNQRVAASCGHVTLMAAGLPMTLKDTA